MSDTLELPASVSLNENDTSGLIATRSETCQIAPIADGAEIVSPMSPFSCAAAGVVIRLARTRPAPHTIRPFIRHHPRSK